MKAILVIDIPDYVNTVTKGILKPIGTVGKLEIGYGSDDGEMTRFQFINTDGALLKPMPQKKEIDVKKIEDIMHIEFQFTDVIRDKYIADIKLETDKLIAIGYNRCISEILGEEG